MHLYLIRYINNRVLRKPSNTKITSQATRDGVEMPMALMKHTDKIERSSDQVLVSAGMEQAKCSLDTW